MDGEISSSLGTQPLPMSCIIFLRKDKSYKQRVPYSKCVLTHFKLFYEKNISSATRGVGKVLISVYKSILQKFCEPLRPPVNVTPLFGLHTTLAY